jgi:gamma-glutamyltranspeptidase/glutathione hydrolase
MEKLFLVLVFMGVLVRSQDRVSGSNAVSRSVILAQNGMACTSQPLATQAALDILKQGGTAIDAAIAANVVNSVVEPANCGIGGDLFAIVWDAQTKKLFGLNASGRSPKSLTLEAMKKMGHTKVPFFGPLAVSVPGCVDGWSELHKKFGKLPFEKLFDLAIEYAENGFPVTEIAAHEWKANADYFPKNTDFESVFVRDGKTPAKGEVFKNQALANSLKKIAKGGRDAFYKGEIAKEIEVYMANNGGYLKASDLIEHKSEWVEPVSTNYRGYDLWELPPNGQGIAALQMLNILEEYDIKSMGYGSPEYLHVLIEAKKLAFEDRAKYYADPHFNNIPIKELISKEYAAKRRKLIDPNKAAEQYAPGVLESGETIYLTVADKEGNMVSLIQSLFNGFGSTVTPPKLGFPLQNRGELFTFEEGHFNKYQPGKRPFHTIIPAFVTKNGEPFMSYGVMGGAMQPQGHVQILINMVDFGVNVQEAGDMPRIRHSGSSQPTGSKMASGGIVNFEHGFEQETLRKLVQKGHFMKFNVGGFGGYQAIMYDSKNKVYHGASESRLDGQASGY